MEKRQCGECTACCQGWLSSKVVGMKPGKPCPHCTATGCAIYPDRPQDPCVDFACAWLREGSPLPDEMRPDRAGVIVMFDRAWHDWEVITAVPTGPTIPEPSLQWLLAYAQEIRKPLLFNEYLFEGDEVKGQKNTGFGPPAFREAVKLAIGPQDIFRMNSST